MAFKKGVVPAGKLVAKPFGLFSAADVSEKGSRDEHWGQGFDAMSAGCAFDVSLIDVCGSVDKTSVYSADGDRWTRVRPFGIIAMDTCFTVGEDETERRKKVIDQLDLATQKAVEKEFWSGLYRRQFDADQEAIQTGSSVPFGYLSHPDTAVVESGALRPDVALALLEQAFADASPGLQGTVHLSPLVAEILRRHLVCEGDSLYTKVGNKVVVGAGYDGSGPSATLDGPESKFVHWMYITGQVMVMLGNNELITTTLAQAVNASTNETTFAAERPAAVYTSDSCYRFAAKTDIRL